MSKDFYAVLKDGWEGVIIHWSNSDQCWYRYGISGSYGEIVDYVDYLNKNEETV